MVVFLLVHATDRRIVNCDTETKFYATEYCVYDEYFIRFRSNSLRMKNVCVRKFGFCNYTRSTTHPYTIDRTQLFLQQLFYNQIY